MPTRFANIRRSIPATLVLAAGTAACLADNGPTADKPAEDRPLPLLMRMTAPEACYPANLTEKELADLLARTSLLPPAGDVQPGGLRYFTTGTVWTGTGQQGPAGRAQRAALTYSFPDDGVDWDGMPNTLNAVMTSSSVFGAANLDKGRELIRQGLATWRRLAGLTYSESPDNNSSRSGSTTHTTTRGDIRIGGNGRGTPNFLAYDYYPNGGADMLINTDYFGPGNLGSTSNTYRYLRNVISHEHGHGLGHPHPVPCDHTKLMEPFINTNFDGAQIDDIRGVQRNHGDRFSGNNSAANATAFGNLTSPSVRSVIQRDLSTNGTSGFNNTDEDWFSFTLSSAQNVTITVDPTGGSYSNGQQSTDCNTDSLGTVNADQAGNLTLELRNSSGTTIIASAAAGGPGVTETISQTPLAAGTYTVRVVDVGPNPTADQTVQLYDLIIRVGTSKAPPAVIAGLDKRVQAGTTCFFYGALNSRATESGTSLTTYAWDLDGNGTFEIANSSQPTRVYNVNGVYPVTLRVTDSNGMSATDTIMVTVYGGTAGLSVSDISPVSGLQGTSVPVTITGTALHNVDAPDDVVVSGTGVTVVGSPSVNPGGTVVTGLSFLVDPAAPTGPRNVTVTTEDGTATVNNSFTVNVNLVPAVTSVSPAFGRQGFSVPVSISGANFGGVTSASNVVVSGTGVTVSGTPLVGAGNTSISGLSFDIADDAPSGTQFRSVTVTTADGSGAMTMGFRVRCLTDWDGNSVVTPSDIATFINNWTMDISQSTLSTDVDHDGVITPSDIAVFIARWFNSLSTGC
ncbi:MAG: pre-peptidase C-terminal domain-containing protein [Phycisphaeraceae bacterium]|nr:pre-peptidase C-terminal domain-containing protein [Phycisphaeraceae bacterium]